MLLRPTCVQAQFTSDDQQLATLWYQAGVPVETFRHAWLLVPPARYPAGPCLPIFGAGKHRLAGCLLPPTNYKRNPKKMMMFTFIPLLIDGGTYSQA